MSPSEQVVVQAAPAGLQPGVLCAIWRQVGAGATVTGAIHANSYACLNLVTQGRVAQGAAALPACFVTGPFTQPLPTTAEGPMRSVSVVLQPWLVTLLFGAAPSRLIDGWQDLTGRPDALLEAVASATLQASGPLWTALAQALPPGAGDPARQLALGVLRQQGLQAALTAAGLGERHYRRVFSAYMGLPPRTWLRLQRFDAMAQRLATSRSLGELAAEAGYADQAHLTRETRAVAGQAPAKLREGLVQRAPGLWSLRPAEVRFVQDGSPALS